MIHIEVATLGHGNLLLANMRECDRKEVEVTSHLTVAQSVALSVGHGAEAGFIDGELAALWGVASMGRTGGPWMLGTNAIEASPYEFLAQSRIVMSSWKDRFDYLFNYVHAENVASIRWLKWLGFSIYPEAPYGPYGAMFRKFEWSA